jgi:hypothetical protein
MLNMTINTVGTLNLSTLFGALFVFSAFIETLIYESHKNSTIENWQLPETMGEKYLSPA